ncbi:unnamed protein product [Agarophyton chilense]
MDVFNPSLLVQQSVRISNDLYGNNLMSAHELAKGYTRPLVSSTSLENIPEDIVHAQQALHAMRRLSLILRSKSLAELLVSVRDRVEVFVKTVLDRTLPDPASFDADFSSPLQIHGTSSDTNLPLMPNVGDTIEVYWPLGDNYYPGTVVSHIEYGDRYQINYDDREQETLHLHDETWRGAPESGLDAVNSNEIQLSPGMEITSHEKDDVKLYFQEFQHKEFLANHAQGLPAYVIQNAYSKEVISFKRTIKEIHVSKIPCDANIISSHVLHKVKSLDDGLQIMKARIAPHGIKDKEIHNLRTDCATCPPVGFRILLSFSCLFKWALVKVDVKSAFLQTGEAKRDVYVVPQLFYIRAKDALQAIAVKLVDDIPFSGTMTALNTLLKEVGNTYKLGTIVYGPGTFTFFGLSITQHADFTITMYGEEKLQALEACALTRMRRQQNDSPLNELEYSELRSLNGSLGWIGVAASPFFSLVSSVLQQKIPRPTVPDLLTQTNLLRSLKILGSTIQFKRATDSKRYHLSLLVFADASRPSESGKLGFIAGLMIGEHQSGSFFHTLNWSSTKSKRPVHSVGAAETLAANMGIDEGKFLTKAYSCVLKLEVDLVVGLDYKDLYDSLSTCRSATDKSIRGDVAEIRYDFETRNISRMVWIPGKTNLSDPLTKMDSPLDQTLQLLIFSSKLPLSFPEAQSRSSNVFLG